MLSHRLNDSFRILTAASVILLPLTLIAWIYGMNGGLEKVLTVLLIVVLMAVVMCCGPRSVFGGAGLAEAAGDE